MSERRRTAVMIAAVVVGACAACGPDPTPGAGARREPRPEASSGPLGGRAERAGRPAPDAAPNFTLTDFNGRSFELYDHLGKPVVINFWDSW